MRHIFIIEHLEPRMWRWCEIEYKSISKIVGKENLWITNLNRGSSKLAGFAKVFNQSVGEMNLSNACVLDPEASKTLTTKNCHDIEYFIFGGILGDYPPKKRTKKELTQFVKGASAYNIGKKQFSTDNAVYVVNEIIQGTGLDKMSFKNNLSIKVNDIESVDLPYCYPIVAGKPRISDELVSYIKRKRKF